MRPTRDGISEAGMSLLELMISVAIISIVLLSVIYAMTGVVQAQRNARLQDRALAEEMSLADELVQRTRRHAPCEWQALRQTALPLGGHKLIYISHAK